MANVNLILPPSARNTRSARSFKRFIGQHGKASNLDEATGEFFLFEGDQATIDAQLITYTADQVNIDTDYDDVVNDERKDRDKDAFDEKNDLTALIKEMVEQLNELRALHALPPLNFGTVNADIRNRIE